MAFTKVIKSRYNATNAGSKVAVAAYKTLSKAANPTAIATLSFRIPLTVVQEVDFPIENKRIRVIVHEGTGEDAGFMMISHEPEGYTAVQSGGVREGVVSAFGFAVSMNQFTYYSVPEYPQMSVEVDHVIDNGSLIIEMPSWFVPDLEKMKKNGLAVAKPEPKPEPVKEEERKQPLNRRDRRHIASIVARELK